MPTKVQIAPSILSADFGELNREIASIESYSDALHIDVMDGHFVPNLTFGAPVLRCIKTELPLHCHLMVDNPEGLLKDFVDAKADTIIVHIEVTKNPRRLIQKIKGFGVRAGISLNPGTPVSALREVLDDLDMVLVMSVNPGFGGQAFLPVALEKISAIRQLAPDLDIAVDGGINAQTAKKVVKAGANILVAGSYIFKASDRVQAINSLRS